MTKTNLWDLSLERLTELLVSWGEPAYRAGQIYRWLYQGLVLSPAEMTNLPAVLRSAAVLLLHTFLFVGGAIFIFNRKDVLS